VLPYLHYSITLTYPLYFSARSSTSLTSAPSVIHQSSITANLVLGVVNAVRERPLNTLGNSLLRRLRDNAVLTTSSSVGLAYTVLGSSSLGLALELSSLALSLTGNLVCLTLGLAGVGAGVGFRGAGGVLWSALD